MILIVDKEKRKVFLTFFFSWEDPYSGVLFLTLKINLNLTKIFVDTRYLSQERRYLFY